MEGAVFRSETLSGRAGSGGESLEDYVKNKMERFNNPSSALKIALPAFVKRLAAAVKSGGIRIGNAEELLVQLQSLRKGRARTKKKSRSSIDPNWHLEMFTPGYGVDRIQWLSLCADIIGWVGDDVDEAGIEDMLDRAKTFYR